MRLARIIVGLAAAWGCAAACAADDRATPRPADGQAVTAASQPAKTPPGSVKRTSGNSQVDQILDRLEAKGQAIKGLRCGLTYKYVTVVPVEDAQIKEGELLFARAEPNSKFLIHFTRKIADGVVIKHDEYFLFDGEWLTDRIDKSKTITRRQVVRKGERIDPFRLGEGPFPLPFGQKREEILRNFTVTLAKIEPGDPRNAYHLHCVPLPRTELARKYTRVEIYVDKKIELPVRIVTERVSDGNRIEVDFKQIDADEAPAMSRFRIRQPGEKLDDYTVTEEPLPPLPKGGGAGRTGDR